MRTESSATVLPPLYLYWGRIDIFVEWGKNQLSSESLRDSGNLFSSI